MGFDAETSLSMSVWMKKRKGGLSSSGAYLKQRLVGCDFIDDRGTGSGWSGEELRPVLRGSGRGGSAHGGL